MEILEYGDKDKEKIILIHGFESPHQIWNEYIEYYKKDYHLIVPILQGHNPDEKEEFISFRESVKEIEDYYISRYGNRVFAIYGMSMGGVLSCKLWENKKLSIDKIILESSPLLSFNKLMEIILVKQYLMLTHKTQQRDKKVIAQAINSIIKEEYLGDFLNLIDNISDTTIVNYIRELRNYKLPSTIDTPNTEIYYYYGSKINELLARKTAKYIQKNYTKSTIICFKGKGHCEDSLMNPQIMIKELNKALTNNK